MQERFRDRTEAGRALAGKLQRYTGRHDVLVLALPRGGVPVAYEIAKALKAPLDVFIVRKLGAPDQKELAMGAIASGGVRVLNPDVIRALRITDRQIDAVAAMEEKELERREHLYRNGRPAPNVEGRIVILVDDGVATGATMLAAIAALRSLKPARVVVAVGAAPTSTCAELMEEADDLVCSIAAGQFHAVGLWYDKFTQTTDEEVRDLLERAGSGSLAAASSH